MKLLVAVASKYGGTQEIAFVIGKTLSNSGIDTDIRNVEIDGDVAAYDAVILGSAVYNGNWLKSARDFAELHAEELAVRPTWLFSSGPVGKPLKPAAHEQVLATKIMPRIRAREHRIFAGKLDKNRLNLRERAIVRLVSGAEGDFRDWDEIESWAHQIAEILNRERVAVPRGNEKY